jgi:hypothetical protein
MEQEKGLVARYLQAVRFWLPKGQQDDIGAELAEDLQSRMEEREATLGRKLDEAEILKQSGSPVLVASRYLPQKSLIGPVLFPVYVFMLKMVALFYLVPWLMVLIGLSLFHYHESHFGEGLRTFWTVAFTSVGAMTVVFALLERYQEQTNLFENWDPRKLPAVRIRGQIKRSASIAEIIANAVLALWWANGWASTFIFSVSHIRITVNGTWTYIVWALVAQAMAHIAMAIANLMRPHWTPMRAWLRLALDGAGAGIFCWFLKQQVLVDVAGPGLTRPQALAFVNTVNVGLTHVFPFCVAASVLIVAISDLPRIVRNWPSSRRPIGRASFVR